jgi:cobalt-zinc-cadmium efflux system outer membrane protein
LTLSDALALSRQNNPRLLELRAFADAADADRVTASRRLNPAFTFDAAGYALFSNRPFANGQELTFRLDQELELGGRRDLRTASASSAADVARLNIAAGIREIELSVKRIYLAAILAQEDRMVAQASLEEIDRVITLNEARFKLGDVSGAELRRVKVERLRFVDDVFSADLALRNAKSALLALLNAPALDQPLELTESLTSPGPLLIDQTTASADPATVQRSIAEALGRRPDVVAAQRDVTRAETATRLQRALQSPNPTVGGGYRRDLGENAIVFGVTVPLPLFNKNQGGVGRADAEYRAASARASGAETLARLDIQQARNAVATNSARVEYIEREHLKNARESRDLTLESYRLGAAGLIDFLDAQRAFRDTQRIYNRALYDRRISVFELTAALGLPDVR